LISELAFGLALHAQGLYLPIVFATLFKMERIDYLYALPV
jgi:hypothetical protein